MKEIRNVRIKVLSQKGTCAAGHKVGDEWVVGEKTPGGLCLFAFSALLPTITPLMFGSSFPWESEPDMTTAVCPDPENPVVFELRSIQD